MNWCVIATWSFSLEGVEYAARQVCSSKANALDAVEQVARWVEDDPTVDTVGYGGLPNCEGEVELDAAMMDGSDLSIGAVASVRGFRHPITIARHILHHSPHHFLVGTGAEAYARKIGMEEADLLTEKSRQAWEEKKREWKDQASVRLGHDTVGIVALDQSGDMAVATSTSGIAFKHPGRVGDSPLVGSGFYADNEVGGAAATGVGEDIMKGCISFLAVQLMRMGRSPQEAAENAILKTHRRLLRAHKTVGNMAIVCADRSGRYGAAANHPDFTYVVATDSVAPCVFVAPCIGSN